MLRIIVIDDDIDTCKLLKTALGKEGFRVFTASSGAEGLSVFQKYKADLILLDVNLPDTTGPDLCSYIRHFSNIPIIMISAYAKQEHSIIDSLNKGADEYLIKPIDLEILKAYIFALLRRSQLPGEVRESNFYIDSHLLVDFESGHVMVEGTYVSIAPLEYRLLALLVQNAEQVITMEEIIEELWGNVAKPSYPHIVRGYIKHLRQLIERTPSKPTCILTEYGLGYRFIPRD